MNRQKLNKIMDLCSDQLKSSNLRCIEARWNSHDKKLQLFIDFADRFASKNDPLEIEECVKATKVLNECSELDESFSASYELEISSPGIERPIRLQSDFAKLVGEVVNVHLKSPLDGARTWEGQIEEVSELGEIVLNTSGGPKQIPIGELLKANLVYDWNRVEI